MAATPHAKIKPEAASFTGFFEVGGDKAFLEIDRGKLAHPRARQNVIFELGFFIGALGPARGAALVKGDIDLPSDYDLIARWPPNELTRSADPLVILKRTFNDARLFQCCVLVQWHHSTRIEFEQRSS